MLFRSMEKVMRSVCIEFMGVGYSFPWPWPVERMETLASRWKGYGNGDRESVPFLVLVWVRATLIIDRGS